MIRTLRYAIPFSFEGTNTTWIGSETDIEHFWIYEALTDPTKGGFAVKPTLATVDAPELASWAFQLLAHPLAKEHCPHQAIEFDVGSESVMRVVARALMGEPAFENVEQQSAWAQCPIAPAAKRRSLYNLIRGLAHAPLRLGDLGLFCDTKGFIEPCFFFEPIKDSRWESGEVIPALKDGSLDENEVFPAVSFKLFAEFAAIILRDELLEKRLNMFSFPRIPIRERSSWIRFGLAPGESEVPKPLSETDSKREAAETAAVGRSRKKREYAFSGLKATARRHVLAQYLDAALSYVESSTSEVEPGLIERGRKLSLALSRIAASGSTEQISNLEAQLQLVQSELALAENRLAIAQRQIEREVKDLLPSAEVATGIKTRHQAADLKAQELHAKSERVRIEREALLQEAIRLEPERLRIEAAEEALRRRRRELEARKDQYSERRK